MEPEIRVAQEHELPDVRRCYDRNEYRGPIEDGDVVLVAVADDDVVAAVRLVDKYDCLTLRGMFMDAHYRRQGLGTRMLHAFADLIGDRACWLVCYADLPAFYGQIGFEPVADEDAPEYLQERAAAYREEHGPQVIMRRPGR